MTSAVPSRALEQNDIAWIAGYLEGEGSFTVRWETSSANHRYPTIYACCGSTDEDLIRRLHSLCGGSVYGPTPKYAPYGRRIKDRWDWRLPRNCGLRALLEALLPYMGSRRTAKIRYCLDLMDQHPTRTQKVRAGAGYWSHGRYGFEAHGCRCEVCREAKREHNRKYSTRSARKRGQQSAALPG
jgi:hypothetical protein